MNVGSKVATGFGVLLTLLLAVLAYDLSLVRELTTVNRSLATSNFRSILTAIEIERHLNQIDEFTKKLIITHDPGYAARIDELHESVAGRMADLGTDELSLEEATGFGSLSDLWSEYSRLRSFQPLIHSETESATGDEIGTLLQGHLERLKELATELVEISRTEVRAQVEQTQQSSAAARRLSGLIVFLSVALSLLILLLTIHSIRGPLKKLTEGTRAVAEGRHVAPLDVSGGDEISRLAESFNHMVVRLGELDRMKSDFVSNVSHDLRTPLVAMHETNAVLLEELPGTLNDQQKRMLSLNQQSSERLSTMITKLLDLARLEAGAADYDFDRLDLGALAEVAAADFQAKEMRAGPWIDVVPAGEPVMVRGDRERLLQILDNLVDNAAKFSATDSLVTVRTLIAKADANSSIHAGGHLAQVEVWDVGPGVPDADKERIFEKFFQAKNRGSGDGGGVGLGLAICREIATAHGGRVGVKDNPGGGSVFFLELPLEARGSQEALSPESVGRHA